MMNTRPLAWYELRDLTDEDVEGVVELQPNCHHVLVAVELQHMDKPLTAAAKRCVGMQVKESKLWSGSCTQVNTRVQEVRSQKYEASESLQAYNFQMKPDASEGAVMRPHQRYNRGIFEQGSAIVTHANQKFGTVRAGVQVEELGEPRPNLRDGIDEGAHAPRLLEGALRPSRAQETALVHRAAHQHY